MPISFRSAFAAGAAAEAARQSGKAEPEQLREAQETAIVVDELDAKEAGKRSIAAPVAAPAPTADSLETIEATRRDAPAHHRPTQPPGPGLLGRIARWLNVK